MLRPQLRFNGCLIDDREDFCDLACSQRVKSMFVEDDAPPIDLKAEELFGRGAVETKP